MTFQQTLNQVQGKHELCLVIMTQGYLEYFKPGFRADKSNKKIFHSYVEALLFLTAAALIEHLIRGHVNGWMGISDVLVAHPFIIGIWVFGIVYGYRIGFFTFVGALLILLNGNPELLQNPLKWDLQYYLPWMMLVSAILSGAVNHLIIEKLLRTGSENTELDRRIKDLDNLNMELLVSNLKLEKKIVSRFETFQTLYEVSENLNKLHLNEIYDAIPELLVNLFEADKASFFLLQEDDQLIVRSKAGWKDDDQYRVAYSSDTHLYRKLKENIKLNILGPMDLGTDDKDGLFVMPISGVQSGLIGFVRIEAMQVEQINESNLNLMRILGKWMNRSIQNAISYSDFRTHQMYDSVTGLLTETYFWKFLQKHVTRAIRNQFNVVVVIYRFRFDEDAGEEQIKAFLTEEARMFEHNFRGDDELCLADTGRDYHFLVSMLHTSIEQSEIPLQRIEKRFAEMKKKQDNRVAISVEHERLSLMDGSLFIHPIVNENLQTKW